MSYGKKLNQKYSKKNQFLKIYTDGSYSVSHNSGGWAFIVVLDEEKVIHKDYGKEKNTTSNRMELLALLKALEYAKTKNYVNIISDSKYVVNGYNYWVENWKRNSWKASKNKEVKNRDLWEKIDVLKSDKIFLTWKKGKTDKFNLLVDSLCSYEKN